MEIYFFIMIHFFWIRRWLPFKFFLNFFFGRFLVRTRCRLSQIASGFASL